MGVFEGGSWVGASVDAAYAAYKEAAALKFHQADISKVAAGLFKQAGGRCRAYQETDARGEHRAGRHSTTTPSWRPHRPQCGCGGWRS